MDAFLFERGHSMLERPEGMGVPRSVELHIWPYVEGIITGLDLHFKGLITNMRYLQI